MIERLTSKSTFCVACHPGEQQMQVGILIVREQETEVRLFDPDSGAHYQVRLNLQPGCYFSHSLELTNEHIAVQN